MLDAPGMIATPSVTQSAGWDFVVGQLISNNPGFFEPGVDWLFWSLSLIGLTATLVTAALVVHVARSWQGGTTGGRLRRSLVAAAAVLVLAFAWTSHLITASRAY